jgi:hypothetical protein
MCWCNPKPLTREIIVKSLQIEYPNAKQISKCKDGTYRVKFTAGKTKFESYWRVDIDLLRHIKCVEV